MENQNKLKKIEWSKLLQKYSSNKKWVKIIKEGKFEQSVAISTVNLTEKKLLSVNPSSIPDAIQSNTPSIIAIKKYQGEAKAKAVIVFFITKMNQVLNVSHPMSQLQITIAADLILNEYRNLKISDLRMVLNTMLKSEIYNRLDAQVVITVFRKYWEERLDQAAYLSQQRSDVKKQEPFSKDMAKKLVEKFKPYEEEVTTKKPKMSFDQFKSDKLMMDQLKAGFELIERSDGMDFDTWIRFKYENM